MICYEGREGLNNNWRETFTKDERQALIILDRMVIIVFRSFLKRVIIRDNKETLRLRVIDRFHLSNGQRFLQCVPNRIFRLERTGRSRRKGGD